MFFTTIGVGFALPTLVSIALHHVVKHAGLASALVGSMQFLIAAVISTYIGSLVEDGALPFAYIICGNIPS